MTGTDREVCIEELNDTVLISQYVIPVDRANLFADLHLWIRHGIIGFFETGVVSPVYSSRSVVPFNDQVFEGKLQLLLGSLQHTLYGYVAVILIGQGIVAVVQAKVVVGHTLTIM